MRDWIIAFTIPLIALVVGPAYLLLTHSRPTVAKNVRVALILIPVLQILISAPVVMRLKSLLQTSVGLFDDAMYVVNGMGALCLVASIITILLDVTLSTIWTRAQQRHSKNR